MKDTHNLLDFLVATLFLTGLMTAGVAFMQWLFNL